MRRALKLGWTRLHVRLYRLTGGRVLGRIGGQPVLLLRTTGRRTGRSRVTPVQYVPVGGQLVLVAANHGAPRPPQWLANLRVNRSAGIELGPERRQVEAHIAEAGERGALWKQVTAANARIEDVQRRAGHELPLVVLS